MPASIGQKVDPHRSQIEIDGIPLPTRPDLVYYLLYKPPGTLSTVSDPQGRPTVLDLVPATTKVHPVGRLDADSEGLLILTNDGDLTHRITHPRHGVTKTYVALVAGNPGPSMLGRLTRGVELDDGLAAAVSARTVDQRQRDALIEVVMVEGRNREVRRLLDAVGHPVKRLVRTAIGPLRDPKLAAGKWRELTVSEVRQLYEASSPQGPEEATQR